MTYDLNSILITPHIHRQWMAHLSSTSASLQKKYPDLQSHEIPDEMFRCDGEGTNGEIFVTVRGTTVKMSVPAKEWAFV